MTTTIRPKIDIASRARARAVADAFFTRIEDSIEGIAFDIVPAPDDDASDEEADASFDAVESAKVALFALVIERLRERASEDL